MFKIDIKTIILPIVCLVLFGIIIFQRSCGPVPPTPKPRIDTIVRVDTLRIHDTVPGKPILVYSKPEIKWRDSIQYIADTSYKGLLAQYDALGDKYFSRNVYKTNFILGAYGTAAVSDTIVANKIVGNSIDYHLNIPEKTTTITIHEPYKPKSQLYIGGGLNGSPSNLVSSVELGLLYKNKKDQIFGAKVQQSFTLGTSYGVSSYWKIKF